MADIVAQLKQQFSDIAAKIGLVKKGPAKPGAVAKPGVQKPKFNFNLFIKATQDFWKTFIEVKLPAFFKNPIPYFKKYPTWFKKLTKDEMAAHIIVYTGALFLILGIVFIII